MNQSAITITHELFEQLREALIHAACETPVGDFAIKYSDARVALEAASGAAHTSKTIDVKWHHDLAKKETDQ